MVDNVQLLILILGITCFVFMILGLIRPWAMLWWEDVQNRKKVIVVYGSLTLFFVLFYYGLKIFL